MKKTVKSIKSMISKDFVFFDVGARWGLQEPWESFQDILSVISFEPDKEEFDLLPEFCT